MVELRRNEHLSSASRHDPRLLEILEEDDSRLFAITLYACPYSEYNIYVVWHGYLEGCCSRCSTGRPVFPSYWILNGTGCLAIGAFWHEGLVRHKITSTTPTMVGCRHDSVVTTGMDVVALQLERQSDGIRLHPMSRRNSRGSRYDRCVRCRRECSGGQPDHGADKDGCCSTQHHCLGSHKSVATISI